MPGQTLTEEDIFDVARRIDDPGLRRAYIDQACGEDRFLRERIESLLRIHDRDHKFLESPSTAVRDSWGVAPGTVIGPYTLLESIGEGGMGVVYRAEQREPIRREVALKIIRPGMDSSQFVARLAVERQALAVMDHPNIAKVLDAGESQPLAAIGISRPYIVMELVRGVPITKYCDEHHLTPRQRLELFIPVCQAVQHAHQKGIVHRDLKPSNVLVIHGENGPVPKIIDFGVAKALNQRVTDQTANTRVGAIIGTLEYMSPEQAMPSQADIDTRSDIYSLGVLLYELLTGTTPLQKSRLNEGALLEALRLIREEEPQKPSTRLSTVDELPTIAANRGLEPRQLSGALRGDLDWIVMKSLEKDRSRRYETANGMARDLQRFLSDEPVEARPPSASYRMTKFVRRNKVVVVAAAVCAVNLVAATAVSGWLAWRATQAERVAKNNELSAIEQQRRADEKSAIAEAVSQFVQADLLGQANIANQPAGTPRNRNITVRELLDRASKQIEGRFSGKELTEASIRATIGGAYRALGEYSEAQQHLKRAVDLYKQSRGVDSFDTLDCMNALAVTLKEGGLPGEAEPWYRESYERMSKLRGENHPDTLRMLHNLALFLGEKGNLDESAKTFQRVFDGYRQTFGDNDERTLNVLNSLAVVSIGRGDYPKAEIQLKQLIDALTSQHSADHPKVLTVSNNLGRVYLEWKRFDEAEAVLKRTLTLRTNRLGADHPETLNTQHDLALVWVGKREFDKAAAAFEDALRLSRKKPGPTHPVTLRLMNGLARTMSNQGRAEEAGAIFREILDIRRSLLGPTHRETLVSINNLAAYYQMFNQLDKAEPLFIEAAQGAIQNLGLNNAETRQYVGNVAKLYDKLSKPEEAAKWRQKLSIQQP